MRRIKLQFTQKNFLDELLSDINFCHEINYLKPKRTTDCDIILNDPITLHDYLDSEIVILSIFSRAVKRNFYSNTEFDIEFLSPFVNTQKGGLHHNGHWIIKSTSVEY